MNQRQRDEMLFPKLQFEYEMSLLGTHVKSLGPEMGAEFERQCNLQEIRPFGKMSVGACLKKVFTYCLSLCFLPPSGKQLHFSHYDSLLHPRFKAIRITKHSN